MKHISPEILKQLRSTLEEQKARLLASKASVDAENPAMDENRVNDNASPDADASEEVLIIRSEVVGSQLDDSLTRVEAALQHMEDGTYGLDEYGHEIPVERLLADPTAITLVSQAE